MTFATVPLKHLCREPVAYGANIASDEYTPIGVRFLRTTDITDSGQLIPADQGVFVDDRNAIGAMLQDGDILMSRSGTIGRALHYNLADHGPCAHAGYLVRFRPKRDVDPRWIFYFTKSTLFADQIAENVVESTIANFNGQKFANMIVPLPLLRVQRRIAEFLDGKTAAIDELIAEKERLVALLAEKRQAFITQAITKGLDPTAPMKDSGVRAIGLIPARWGVKRLKHISPSQTVGVVVNPSAYYADEGPPFLFGGNVRENRFLLDNVRHLSEESNLLLSKSTLHAGDLVTVRVGYPGVTAVIPPELDGCNCASMMIIRRAPTFSSEWLCFAMNSRVGRQQVEIVQYGAAQEQFNISHAVEFRFPFPPLSEQEEIVRSLRDRTRQLDSACGAIERHIDRLREYRQALITAAVTGKLNLAQAEPQTERVLEQVAESA